MATLEDWKRQIAGDSDLDKSEFADLIPRDGDEAFLREAFLTLPKGQVLIERIRELLLENDNTGLYVLPKKENRLPLSDIGVIADEYRQRVAEYMQFIGQMEMAKEVMSPEVQVVDKNSDFYDTIKNEPFPHSEAISEVEFQFSDALDAGGDHMFVLDEAVLFLTKYPAITRYIMEDVVKFPLKHESYYRLWKGGGDIYFFKNRVLLLCENPDSP